MTDDSLGFAGLSDRAIHHWRLVLLSAIGLMLLAVMAWARLPKLEDPAVESPKVFIQIPYPGATPKDVESKVIQVIESDLYAMDGVVTIESTAVPNGAAIKMTFEEETAMDAAVEAVRGKILGKREALPMEMSDPVVRRGKVTTFIAQMVVLVKGNRSDRVLNEEAKRLKDTLTGVPGVGSVVFRGDSAHAVSVQIDPLRLSRHHLAVEDVIDHIKRANVRIPAGELKIGKLATVVAVDHELTDAADVEQIIVGASTDKTGATRTVTLDDVATVREGYRAPAERMLHDGVPAVGLEIRFRPGEDATRVGTLIHAALAAERPSLPAATELVVTHDQPESIRRSLHGLTSSLLEGVVLVLIIITLGMGWRAASVVAFVLPLSLAGGMLGLYFLGFSLEMVSIGGLIVAIGLLVDDAVVVTESAQIMRDRGLGPRRGAVVGTARVFWANNGTTAVACASFLPLFFMGGDTGRFVRGLPVAVILCLVTSLLIAQTLTPWMAMLILEGRREDEDNVALGALKRLYARCTPWVLSHPGWVIAASTAMLVGSVMLLPKIGVQFFSRADKPLLFVKVEMPRGTDSSMTAAKVVEVMAALRDDPSVKATSATVGGRYPALFLGRTRDAVGKDFGDLLVELSEPSSDAIARRLRGLLSPIVGAHITVEELYHGVPVAHPVSIRLQGNDHQKLGEYAAQLKADLRAIPGTIDVSDTMSNTVPLTSVRVDADRALRYGVTPRQIGIELRRAYGEDKVTELHHDLETLDVVLERAATDGDPLTQVAETSVLGVGGQRVPILATGEVTLARGSAELRRRNGRRVVEVFADVEGGTLPQSVITRMKPALAKLKLDPGYTVSLGGEQAETERGFRNLGVAGMGALMIIFVLLVMMFGSIKLAATVILAVPFALTGALPGLYLTNNPFGFMAFLGLVALIGVYVNHKIYFVDRALVLMRRGMPMPAALRQAGIDRLRPVVLTALTAILGLLPLTLGGGTFWASFGWVSIFGLAMSIPLSLVLLPALLTVVARNDKTLARDDLLPLAAPGQASTETWWNRSQFAIWRSASAPVCPDFGMAGDAPSRPSSTTSPSSSRPVNASSSPPSAPTFTA
jgi:multidrug efflux pump subunit AcrB